MLLCVFVMHGVTEFAHALQMNSNEEQKLHISVFVNTKSFSKLLLNIY
jgi:hypothetical protein